MSSSDKIIEKLTPEQEALLPKQREKWLAIGMSTEPLDFEKAREAAKNAYRLAGLEPPPDDKFYKAECPITAAELAHKLTGRTPHQCLGDMIYGNHSAGWLSFYDTFLQFGLECCKKLEGLLELAKHCGWWAPYDDLAILQDRPCELHVDEDGELHNSTGPAIAYRSGYKQYFIHGVWVPEKVVADPESITLEEIKNEENAEVKRLMREAYGVNRWLADVNAEVVHVDTVPVDSVLPNSSKVIKRALMRDKEEGTMWLVGSDGSTDRVYTMQVPNDVRTCAEAHAALSGGVDDEDIIISC